MRLRSRPRRNEPPHGSGRRDRSLFAVPVALVSAALVSAGLLTACTTSSPPAGGSATGPAAPGASATAPAPAPAPSTGAAPGTSAAPGPAPGSGGGPCATIDLAAATALLEKKTACCIILEPIQAEGGITVPPPGYLAGLRALCDATNTILIFDEVQTGMGRTGMWFGHQHDNVTPDVMTLAKGLGGGLPIGACIGMGRAAALFTPGAHGSTFGGNPVSCAAALAVLDAIEEDDLLSRARVLHERLTAGIVAGSSGLVSHVRGRGLLMAAVLSAPLAADVERSGRAAGIIVNAVAPDAIRFAPALTISDDDVTAALQRWGIACATVAAALVDAPEAPA